MKATAIREFLQNPLNQWERHRLGAFEVHTWNRNEPPRWHTSTAALKHGSARAFLGSVGRASFEAITRALAKTEKTFFDFGMLAESSEPCRVVLWDMMFPVPDEWELPELPASRCPVAIFDDRPDSFPLILLPTYGRGRPDLREELWMESSAIHEAFHALLGRWLGAPRIVRLRPRARWAKFEEMCAVAMEARLLDQGAWIDYGRAWSAALSLSHSERHGAVFLDGDFTHPTNSEDYGHFPFLTFLEEQIWPALDRHHHWLRAVWESADPVNMDSSPWTQLDRELQRDGGLAEIFWRYVREAVQPSQKGSVLARLHEAFGEPASAILHPGEHNAFVLGPMSAQLVDCQPIQNFEAESITIEEPRGISGSRICVFEVLSDGAARCIREIESPPPKLAQKAKIWRLVTKQGAARQSHLLILLSHVDFAAQTSAAFRVEYR